MGVLHWGKNSGTGDSLQYEGEYVNDKAEGVGVMHFRDGSRHAGGERDDLKHGPGVLHFATGFRYEGEFQRDKYNGHGVLWDPRGRAYEAGVWKENEITTPLGRQGR